MIEPENGRISVRRQCELLGIARSGLYYQPRPESEENLRLMRLLDELYTRWPFYGVEKMTEILRSDPYGYEVNAKRVRRLMRKMGLEAIYPRPRLSLTAPGHRIYPYLLKGVEIVRPNQVWSTDITYVRLLRGFVYLVAIMDWYSRYVLSWEVSLSLENDFCISALERALRVARPEIFNSDQGVQFTSLAFTGKLLAHEIQISMDGRGRVFDNIFSERLWRSVKYEEVYLHDYQSVPETIDRLGNYFDFYNRERIHQSLGYLTPEAVYRQEVYSEGFAASFS